MFYLILVLSGVQEHLLRIPLSTEQSGVLIWNWSMKCFFVKVWKECDNLSKMIIKLYLSIFFVLGINYSQSAIRCPKRPLSSDNDFLICIVWSIKPKYITG